MASEKAVFGGGCFWCTEAVFQRLRGVQSVAPGYAGGTTSNPTGEQVYSGRTGHAEVIDIDFDPAEVSYETLLDIFFAFHDPTTLNRQGNDIGTQYRSAIFYANDVQKQQAEAYIQKLTADQTFAGPIVTTLEPLKTVWPAEDYHKNYYDNNPNQPYCQVMISPKLAKLRQKFAHLLKEEE